MPARSLTSAKRSPSLRNSLSPARGWRGVALRLLARRALGVRRVVEQVHVQVAVAVVVEEGGLGRVAGVLEPELLRAVGERAVAVVDVQDVAAVHREVAHARDVDVEMAVAVHVGHRDAGRPPAGPRHARALGDVLEPVVPLVQVEPVGPEVGGEVEVGQPVAVDVARRDAAAVVVVQVVEDVELGTLRQLVGERRRRWSGPSSSKSGVDDSARPQPREQAPLGWHRRRKSTAGSVRTDARDPMQH